jgi:hypothetical protein
MRIREIWSGGQTGADRAALDVAREVGLPTRGWVPRGRGAEDGPIPAAYAGLQETASPDYAERTTLNVRDTDATLIVCRGPLTGGSAFTLEEARRLGRPVLVTDLGAQTTEEAAASILAWLDSLTGTRLNIAGPRASTDPEIGRLVRIVLLEVFRSTAR